MFLWILLLDSESLSNPLLRFISWQILYLDFIGLNFYGTIDDWLPHLNPWMAG